MSRLDRALQTQNDGTTGAMVEEARPRAEQYRRKVQVKLVNKPSLDALLRDCGAAHHADIPFAGRCRRALDRDRDASGDELEARRTFDKAWCVAMRDDETRRAKRAARATLTDAEVERAAPHHKRTGVDEHGGRGRPIALIGLHLGHADPGMQHSAPIAHRIIHADIRRGDKAVQ